MASITNGDAWPHLPSYYKQPGLQARNLRVICIGAGASGLLLAYKIQRNFEGIDLKVFEKNDGVGGTWWENKYPGCACDNYSHTYTYSFEPKTDYQGTLSTSEEIQEYLSSFSKKYGLDKYIKLSTRVEGCWWDENSSLWTVKVKNNMTKEVQTHVSEILVSATGVLNSWKLPDVHGLNLFKGPVAHSAAWDPKIDLKDRNVALIGNGSSAIQILPAILPHVKKVVNMIRTPAWITTPWGKNAPRDFTDEERRHWAENPTEHLSLRKAVEATNNGFFKIFMKGSAEGAAARSMFTQQMSEALQDPNLCTQLIPQWPLGCRRLTPGVGYLNALTDPKTEIVYEALGEVNETSVISVSGREFPVDAIICASGFDTSFKPNYPMVGLAGRNLQEIWDYEPKAYLGLAVPHFPNFFCFLGPNCPIGNGPVLSAIEAQGDYICKFINRIQSEQIRSVSPKPQAADEFMRFKDDFFQTTVWSENCNSWYKLKHNNKIAALWTGSTIHYLRVVENPRYEDWDFTYINGNRWSYLGNGLGPDDVEPKADLAYYIRQTDDSPILGNRRYHGGAWAGNRGESVVGADETSKKEK